MALVPQDLSGYRRSGGAAMSKPKKVLLPYPNVVDQTCEDCKQDLSNVDIFYHYSRFHGHNPKSILSVAEYLKGAYNDIAVLRAEIEELKADLEYERTIPTYDYL